MSRLCSSGAHVLPMPQHPDALLYRLYQRHRPAAPHAPQDFAAWIEVFLGGRWHTFDPRNNDPRIGRILIARGRDAADVPLTLTFGPSRLLKKVGTRSLIRTALDLNGWPTWVRYLARALTVVQ